MRFRTPFPSPPIAVRAGRLFAAMSFALACSAAPLHAKDPAPVKAAGNPPAATAAPATKKAPAGITGGLSLPGLPGYVMPDQYSVDLVMTFEGKSMTMRRAIDGGSIRSEISAEGTEMVMLERAEDNGAVYNIMPSEKMMMKMTPSTMMPPGEKQEAPPADDAAAPKVEKLGVEKLEGRSAVKYRMTAEGHSALAWFEESTGAPLRMEAEGSVIEWKNMKPGPQPAKLFELPKDYQLIDMDEQMKQMQKMGGGAGMGALGGMSAKMGKGGKGAMGAGAIPGGLAGMPGMGAMGGMGGGLSGMAGNYGSQMGANMGQSIGSGIGASFGGPIGAMAGGFIGGKVGGWIGRKAADAVMPGPPSR
ncbi:MAG: hypothetical protein ABIS67_07240 [Candidatus Eisenbacteria bacterium]